MELCDKMKMVFKLRSEVIDLAKAPYKTKQMTELLTLLKSVQGSHVTVNDICEYFQKKGINMAPSTRITITIMDSIAVLFCLSRLHPSCKKVRLGFSMLSECFSPDSNGSQREAGICSALFVIFSLLVILNSRVHKDIQDVHHQRADYQKYGKKHGNSHDKRIIPAQNPGCK